MGLTKHGLPSSTTQYLLVAQERSGIAAVPSRCLLKLAPPRLPYS